MTAMLEKLSPILPARDIAATESFWQRLGFATIYIDPDYLLQKREGAEVHFFHHPDLDPAMNDHGAYLRPADIDALDAEWAAPWGMRELALLDLNGNLIRAGQETSRG